MNPHASATILAKLLTVFSQRSATRLKRFSLPKACSIRARPLYMILGKFTRSGNTKVIAGTLHRELQADLFAIIPAQPYPEDYEQTVAQADQETKRHYEPPLAAVVPNLASYDTLLLGLPIWGMTAPPVIGPYCMPTICGTKRSGRSSLTAAKGLATAWR